MDPKARSPLYLALESGFDEICELLVSKGANVIADNKKMAKMLCIIGLEGNLRKLKVLHHAGSNLQIADYDKRTTGHLAAAEGHIDYLEYLA